MAGQTDIVFNISAETLTMVKNVMAAKSSLEDLKKASDALDADLQKAQKTNDNFGFSAARMAKQMDNLRASYDPVFAASRRYEAAVAKVERAHQKGAITAVQYESMLEGLAQKYLRVDTAAMANANRVGGIAGAMAQHRGAIQGFSYQIQDVAVQLAAGTSASTVFAQQGSQMAAMFGPWGAAAGAALAVLIPLGAVLLSNSEAAKKLSEEAQRQKEVLDALTESARRLRLERQMMFSGAETTQEQEALNEINRLVQERTRLEQNLATQFTVVGNAQAAAQRDAAKYQRDAANARIAEINAKIESLNKERALTAAAEVSKAVAEKMQAVMNTLANSDISSPWANVIGYIQNAINKAGEYAKAAHFGMDTGSADWAQNSLGFTLPGNELLPPQQTGGGGGRSGGGGGGGGVNPLVAQIESLKNSLMTAEQLELQSYQTRQQQLQDALEQKLVTQQEYASLMEQAQAKHQEAMAQIDVYRYGSGLQQAGQFFGDMASALQTGNEKMQKIARVFGAAEALVNAWRAYSQTLADPSLPFLAKFSAAASVLSAGMGAVSAIQSGSKSAGGGRGRSSTGGRAASSRSSTSGVSPLEVRLSTTGGGNAVQWSDVGNLLNRLNDEAGDRGYRLLVAK